MLLDVGMLLEDSEESLPDVLVRGEEGEREERETKPQPSATLQFHQAEARLVGQHEEVEQHFVTQ